MRVRFDHPAAGGEAVNGAASASSPAAGSGQPASAAAKRASNRTFPRYAHTMQSRPMMAAYGPTAAAGSRRGTAINGEADSGVSGLPPRSASPPPPLAPSSPPQPSSPPPVGSPEPVALTAAVHKYDMFAVENDAVLLAVFVSPQAAATDGDTATALRDEFHRQFHAQLADCYPAFLQLAHRPEQALADSRFLPVFAAFTGTLQRMGFFQYQGPPAVDSAQQQHSSGSGQPATAATAGAPGSLGSDDGDASLQDIELQPVPAVQDS